MSHENQRERNSQQRNRIEYNWSESHPMTLCTERHKSDREALDIVRTYDSTMIGLLQWYDI
jgi:hypothetical protein